MRGHRVQKAVVAFHPEKAVAPEELIGFARERLAHYKAPKTIDVVEALPRNPSGKILKRDLRKQYWPGFRAAGLTLLSRNRGSAGG